MLPATQNRCWASPISREDLVWVNPHAFRAFLVNRSRWFA